MEQFRQLQSRVVPLPNENVDTDQIMPARFLKTTEKTGLGKVLFYDWRYDASGNPRSDFILNHPNTAGARVLLTGDNFGCGSSREHAPWGLADFGFRALISTSFADIFRNNCLKNGILPVTLDRDRHLKLFRLVDQQPSAQVAIDLQSQTLSLPDGEKISFPIDPFSKKCLLEGVDELGYLLSFSESISGFESARTASARR
jgi:3-isopropylmalate/(R)-2-methylmalate dehydratase small subunit